MNPGYCLVAIDPVGDIAEDDFYVHGPPPARVAFGLFTQSRYLLAAESSKGPFGRVFPSLQSGLQIYHGGQRDSDKDLLTKV